jgi:hypothetical protein
MSTHLSKTVDSQCHVWQLVGVGQEHLDESSRTSAITSLLLPRQSLLHDVHLPSRQLHSES